MRKNHNGAGSFEQVVKAMKLIQRFNMQNVTSCRLTLVPKTVEYLSQGVIELHLRGFRRICLRIDSGSDWTDTDFISLEKQLKSIVNYYIKNYETSRQYLSWDFIERPILYGMGLLKRHNCLACSENIAITCDGDIIPCYEMVDLNDYIIGNIYDGIDKQRVGQVLQIINEIQNRDCGCNLAGRCEAKCTGNLVRGQETALANICHFERTKIMVSDRLAAELIKRDTQNFKAYFMTRLWKEESAIND
jgi:uncharacterized protein